MKYFVPYFLTVACLIPSAKLFAQTTSSSDYENVIMQRAAKITSALKLDNSQKTATLTNIIAAQYRNLGKIHDEKNAKEAAIKRQQDVNRTAIDSEIKKLEEETRDKLFKLHNQYLQKLSSLLTPQQINMVKDGMTYNVVSVTYNAYVDMLPKLSGEQKQQIMEWLIEAREQAMDAESSEKKTLVVWQI